MLIACLVASYERDVWSLAREKLRDSLVRFSKRDWPIELSFADSPSALVAAKPDVAAISLLRELEEGKPLDEVARRLREDATSLADSGGTVFLCSIFRACPDPEKLERIRRLNLLAAEISRETGAQVIDIDRELAHFGARPLETDYRLRSLRATDLAARVIVDALLEAAFDDDVPVDVLQRAQQHVRSSAASR